MLGNPPMPGWSAMNVFDSATLDSPATPSTVTPGGKLGIALTIAPASALQTGHHDAQNHNTTSLPISVVPSTGLPVTRSVAMNLKMSGAVGSAHCGAAAGDADAIAAPWAEPAEVGFT